MKLKIFAVHDTKAEAFMQPHFFRSRGEAIRAWETTVNDQSTQFSRHPADFLLVEVGEFDDSTGSILPAENRWHIGALEVKKAPSSPASLFEAKGATQ